MRMSSIPKSGKMFPHSPDVYKRQVLGTIFHIGVEKATQLRGTYPWLLWLLPVAGLLIVAIYRLTGTEAVSYTHLDVYKRQRQCCCRWK